MSKAIIGKLAPYLSTQIPAIKPPNATWYHPSLSDYKGKYVVLFFYPLDFTVACPPEIIDFTDHAEEFEKLDVVVLIASTDQSQPDHDLYKTPRDEGGIGEVKIPVLFSDNLNREYGVLKEEDGIAFRGLFIIDPRGVLRHITINDLRVGRSAAETLRLVQAFQYVEKHGDVCPADWTPGEDTIKPDPKGSQQYFGKQK